MSFCRNLDQYFDVIFQLNDHTGNALKGSRKQNLSKSYVKGNSKILAMRSEYFRALFENNESIMQQY